MRLAYVVAVVFSLLMLPFSAIAQSKNQMEQQRYEKQRQQQSYERQRQNNNQVNRSLEQKRYQATRPSTPPPQRSYNRR